MISNVAKVKQAGDSWLHVGQTDIAMCGKFLRLVIIYRNSLKFVGIDGLRLIRMDSDL